MQKKILLLIPMLLLLAGCTTPPVRKEVQKDNLTFDSEKAEAQKQAQEAVAKQTKPISSKPMYQNPPAMTIDPEKSYQATLKTSAGDIVVELNAKATPQTVNNFVFLAREKFYDNTIFHRTIKGFMIQGGDPRGDGTGNPGYKFADEPFTGEYTRGTLAMANSGPDTNGSQFFIMHADTALPKNYVIFGKVISGLEAVDKIATAPTKPSGEGSSPVTPVTIQSVEVAEE